MLFLRTAQHIWVVFMETDGRKSFHRDREREKWMEIKVKIQADANLGGH